MAIDRHAFRDLKVIPDSVAGFEERYVTLSNQLFAAPIIDTLISLIILLQLQRLCPGRFGHRHQRLTIKPHGTRNTPTDYEINQFSIPISAPT